jgi:CheY-like chemotaxis protein
MNHQPATATWNEASAMAVLIIEDELNIRLFISANLEVRGYTVFEAGTGSDGLALMRSRRPRIVILDMLLPDMTGWDVLAAMSADEMLARIPVILMTASVSASDLRENEFANLVERITKPTTVDMLLDAVKHYTGGE